MFDPSLDLKIEMVGVDGDYKEEDDDDVTVDHTVEAAMFSGSRVISFQSAVQASASAMRDLPAYPQLFGAFEVGVRQPNRVDCGSSTGLGSWLSSGHCGTCPGMTRTTP
jgi:hypothetical protein